MSYPDLGGKEKKMTVAAAAALSPYIQSLKDLQTPGKEKGNMSRRSS